MKSKAAYGILTLMLVVAACCLARASTESASSGNDISYGAGGMIHGTIYGFNVWDELVTVSWASVTAMQNGQEIEKVYSNDGFYEMYLPSGDFDIVVDAPGYFTETKSIFMGDGSVYALNFVMERNNQPIPEFPTFAIQFLSASALFMVLVLVRKRHPKQQLVPSPREI